MKKRRFNISYCGKLHTKYFYTDEEADIWKKDIREKYLNSDVDFSKLKAIPNFSRYYASIDGDIYSSNYKNSGALRKIKPSISKDGYPASMFLCDDGKYRSKKIHRLVAITFLDKVDGKNEINHKDGNKQNNSVSNLEWCNGSENVKHAFNNGLMIPKSGELNGNSKLTNEQVRYIRKEKETKGRFWGRNRIAKELGITEKHVQEIANSKEIWKNI